MKIGFGFIGTGCAGEPDTIAAIASTCEACGFHSLWAPEHIVLLDRYASSYPYSADGVMPFETMAIDLLDPFIALTYAAAVTTTIRLGTGVCLLPERQPLVTAKVVASLDKVSKGRFDFGIGLGWLREEFEALQIPWARRAQRTRDYVTAMQALWCDAQSSHDGEFCTFAPVRSYPKPIQQPHPPLIFGGESEAALRRVGEIGNGWWGVNVTPDTARAKIAAIKGYAEAAGRDPAKLSYAVSPQLGGLVTADEVTRFEDSGADQVIIVAFGASIEDYQRTLEASAEALIAPRGSA
ncbi:MAG: LLM class F420-dependent oxidoreductase [Gammaproteobacteria bacterium]